jgi:hypothetical protein
LLRSDDRAAQHEIRDQIRRGALTVDG